MRALWQIISKWMDGTKVEEIRDSGPGLLFYNYFLSQEFTLRPALIPSRTRPHNLVILH
jgi:hypothetical protein